MPTIYDVVADENREVTQEDVDALVQGAKAFAKLRMLIKEAVDESTRVALGVSLDAAD